MHIDIGMAETRVSCFKHLHTQNHGYMMHDLRLICKLPWIDRVCCAQLGRFSLRSKVSGPFG